MRIAIISDIHGNLDAFEQVLADIDHSGIDEIISLGDNIGYGPEPDEVIELIQARQIDTIIGNHELAVNQPKYMKWFNPIARLSIEKTIKLLSDRTLDYIAAQKPCCVRHECRFVHGFPPDSAMIYLFQIPEHRMQQKMEKLDEQICFVGHTHMLEMVSYDGQTCKNIPLKKGVMALDQEKKHIINIGSVGQPRDGDNRAKYAIWDTSQSTLDIRFIAYNIEVVVDKIKNVGLLEEHALEEHARRLW
jgi:predicted phosphodiesterase